MKKNKVSYLILFLSVFTVSSFIVKDKINNDLSEISCKARLNIKSLDNDITAHVMIHLALNESDGWISIKGDIIDGKKITNIRRKIFFNHTRSINLFNVKSNGIIINRLDDSSNEVLEKILPSVYIYENLKADFSIYPQGDNGYFVSSTDQHGVYCAP